jgi:hypothetical protein
VIAPLVYALAPEVDDLSGAVSRMARIAGIDTPTELGNGQARNNSK